ncbi:putative sel1-like repeat-containing protein L18 [Bienertia sinuspersici]
MGKSLPSTTGLKNFSRIISSERINPPKHVKSTSNQKVSVSISKSATQPTKMGRADPAQHGPKVENKSGSQTRFPLSMVVSDCVKRWFQDTLKEAKAGDTAMQVLVGQMYNSGYGVRKDLVKGRNWITAASKGRSSAWKVSNKQPGYNVSDSESEDFKDSRS